MHPSYRATPPHECNFINFSKEREVDMLECYPLLHPDGVGIDEMFLDRMHPTALGHQRLGDALADYLITNRLIDK
jgi:lysophospholipase L1-like esterase